MWMWPTIETGYALAAVALAALVYVVAAVTKFMGQQLGAIERISTTLDNHLHDVADRLSDVANVLHAVEKLLNRIDDNISSLEDKLRRG